MVFLPRQINTTDIIFQDICIISGFLSDSDWHLCGHSHTRTRIHSVASIPLFRKCPDFRTFLIPYFHRLVNSFRISLTFATHPCTAAFWETSAIFPNVLIPATNYYVSLIYSFSASFMVFLPKFIIHFLDCLLTFQDF